MARAHRSRDSTTVPVPPRWRLWLARIGAGDYRQLGRSFLELFIAFGGLKPTDSVLDVGCGLGRMASALTTHIVPPGCYEGFDVSAGSIRWCRRHISSRYPHFAFTAVPVRNSAYNRRGSVAAEAFTFPYADNRFSYVIAISVFTHMLPDGMTRYLEECSRVLAPRGTLFATFFLVSGPPPPTASESFPHDRGTHRLHRPDVPEAAVAYDEAFVTTKVSEAGLTMAREIARGKWSGATEYLTYQDVVIARKV